MPELDVEDQMMRANEQRGEKNLGERIKIRQLGEREILLAKMEKLWDDVMDIATEQNRVIQKMKETIKNV